MSVFHFAKRWRGNGAVGWHEVQLAMSGEGDVAKGRDDGLKHTIRDLRTACDKVGLGANRDYEGCRSAWPKTRS